MNFQLPLREKTLRMGRIGRTSEEPVELFGRRYVFAAEIFPTAAREK